MSETKTKKSLKDYWSKFMSLNGASVFVAMIAVLIIFEIYLQLTRGGSGLLFVTPPTFWVSSVSSIMWASSLSV